MSRNRWPNYYALADPNLFKKIVKSKEKFLAGEKLPDKPTGELLNLGTFSLITNYPKKTRSHTLVSPTKSFASVTGTRRALFLLVDFSDEPATKVLPIM